MASKSEEFSGNVWVGTSLGVLKGVSITKKETLNFLPSGMTLSQTNRSREVLSMCWEHKTKDQLYLALRNGHILAFDCIKRYFTAECDLTVGCGHFVGISRHNNTLITCTDEGSLSFWPDGQEKSEISVGSNIHTMSASPDIPLLVATGGKENDLKLWDGNRPDAAPVFRAKNVPNDYLNLRIPVWVTSLGIVPETGDQPCIAVGTGYHHLRLYDTRAKRRPVYNQLWEQSPITCLEITDNGRYYIVGNSHGQLARIDLRKGGVVNRYHGFGGSVCSVSSYSDSNQSVFAACGLDRYLRIYQTQPPSVLYKTYMKLLCNSVLFAGLDRSPMKDYEEEERAILPATKRKKLKPVHDQNSDDSDIDEVWNDMERIVEQPTTKHRKKTKIVYNKH